MPAQSLQADAFVLRKQPPADTFQAFTLYSAEHGTLSAFQRVSRRSPDAALDLFDEAALVLESSNQGRTWFIREVRLLRRPEGIGRSYECLRLASALADLITRNPGPEDSRPAIAELLRSALPAFAAGLRPDIVYLKSLYRFARDEGYPVKQEWFPSLTEADRSTVATLLNQPLSAQESPPETVLRLQHRLEDYLRGHTEILLD